VPGPPAHRAGNGVRVPAAAPWGSVHRPTSVVCRASGAAGEARLAPTMWGRRSAHASPLQDGARRAATRSMGTDAPEPPVGAGRALPVGAGRARPAGPLGRRGCLGTCRDTARLREPIDDAAVPRLAARATCGDCLGLKPQAASIEPPPAATEASVQRGVRPSAPCRGLGRFSPALQGRALLGDHRTRSAAPSGAAGNTRVVPTGRLRPFSGERPTVPVSVAPQRFRRATNVSATPTATGPAPARPFRARDARPAGPGDRQLPPGHGFRRRAVLRLGHRERYAVLRPDRAVVRSRMDRQSGIRRTTRDVLRHGATGAVPVGATSSVITTGSGHVVSYRKGGAPVRTRSRLLPAAPAVGRAARRALCCA